MGLCYVPGWGVKRTRDTKSGLRKASIIILLAAMITAEISAVSINKYSDMPIESSYGNLQFFLPMAGSVEDLAPSVCAVIAKGTVPPDADIRKVSVSPSNELQLQGGNTKYKYNTYLIERKRINDNIDQETINGPDSGTYTLSPQTFEYAVILMMIPPKASESAPKGMYKSSLSVQELWKGGSGASGEIIIKQSVSSDDIEPEQPAEIEFVSYPDILDLKTFGEQKVASIVITNAKQLKKNTPPTFRIIPVDSSGNVQNDGFCFIHDNNSNIRYNYTLSLRSQLSDRKTYSSSSAMDIPVDKEYKVSTGGGLFPNREKRYECNYAVYAISSPQGYGNAPSGTYSSWIKVELKQP